MRGDLTLLVGQMVNWATLKACDAVFLQRPATEDHVRIVDMAKANGKPVWIDYDDWLYSVPQSNRASRLYNNPKIQNNMSKMLAKADVVTVSTPYLGELIRNILKRIAKGSQTETDLLLNPDKVVVVPNAYDLDIMSSLDEKASHQRKHMAWRGSGTHDKDLLGVTEAIASCVSRNKTWTYSFIGEPFWLSMERLDEAAGEGNQNIKVVETIDPIEYLAFLKTTLPAVMIVPLDDCPFNRAKSNIAWIEATHAGAVTIAPDFEEWHRPGIINYTDAADFEAKLDSFLRGEMDGNYLWSLSRDYVREKLTLDTVNLVRESVLRKLVGR